MQEGRQLCFLHGTQLKPSGAVLHERVNGGRGNSARVVVVDDLLQRLETAVVHVGTGERNVAERGCFEFARIEWIARDPCVAGVGCERAVQPVVAEQVIAELQARLPVAVETIAPKLAARCGLRVAAFAEDARSLSFSGSEGPRRRTRPRDRGG